MATTAVYHCTMDTSNDRMLGINAPSKRFGDRHSDSDDDVMVYSSGFQALLRYRALIFSAIERSEAKIYRNHCNVQR